MIEIINYEPADKNKVTGYVDVKVTINKPATLIFRKIAMLNNNGKKWLNFASFPKPSQDGSQKYFRYAEFTDFSHNAKLLELISEELSKYLQEHKIEKEEPLIDETHLPF